MTTDEFTEWFQDNAEYNDECDHVDSLRWAFEAGQQFPVPVPDGTFLVRVPAPHGSRQKHIDAWSIAIRPYLRAIADTEAAHESDFDKQRLDALSEKLEQFGNDLARSSGVADTPKDLDHYWLRFHEHENGTVWSEVRQNDGPWLRQVSPYGPRTIEDEPCPSPTAGRVSHGKEWRELTEGVADTGKEDEK